MADPWADLDEDEEENPYLLAPAAIDLGNTSVVPKVHTIEEMSQIQATRVNKPPGPPPGLRGPPPGGKGPPVGRPPAENATSLDEMMGAPKSPIMVTAYTAPVEEAWDAAGSQDLDAMITTASMTKGSGANLDDMVEVGRRGACAVAHAGPAFGRERERERERERRIKIIKNGAHFMASCLMVAAAVVRVG